MVEIIWSKRAISDLEQIGEYISLDSFRYAQITIQKLFSKPKILSTFPLMGRKVPEYNRETLRELIETPYRIVYELDETKGKIWIVTIHHSKQILPEDL